MHKPMLGVYYGAIAVLFISGCGTSPEQPLTGPDDLASPSHSASVDPSSVPTNDSLALYQDLLSQIHLADIRFGGLWIDFGAPGRLKYTNGNWNSGWRRDRTLSGETVTDFNRRGRLFVPVESTAALKLRLRAKAHRQTSVQTYVNGNALEGIKVGAEFTTATLQVPASAWRVGDNEISFRSNGNVSVDWLHLGEEASDTMKAKPFVPQVLDRTSDGVSRRALMLPASSSIDWHAQVPPNATLVFGVAGQKGGHLELSIQPDDEEAKVRRFSLSDRFADQKIILKSLAGKIVRIRFVASEGDASISDLRVMREVQKVESIKEPATNVIVVLIDTLRASKLQMYNPKSRVRTPSMDAFAQSGVLFARAQSQENWTKPSVASVLTSLTPMTHRTKEQSSKLPQSALTLGEVFQKKGFRTASFIANGYVSNAFGFDQGWHHYTNYIRERRNTNASNVFGEAIKWIEKNKNKRFFAYVHTIDPHVPYDPPDEFLKMYDARPYVGQVKNRRTHLMMDDAKKNPGKYNFTKRDKERIEALHDGEISYHDREFGMFIDKLDSLGLKENTIVVVTSDHGEEFQEHGSWGHGHSVYQELLQVPLIVAWPGAIKARTVPETVSTMDIGPTVLQAAGVDVPQVFEGQSLLPFALGGWTLGPHVAFSDFMDNRRVVVGGDSKLILRGNLRHAFFDLGADPWEKNEMKGQKQPIAMRYLRVLLGQYLGVPNRGDWRSPQTVGKHRRRQAAKRAPLKKEKQKMTPELCRQLVALGYVTDECERLAP